MFELILVPVDGSRLAEQAMAPAALIADKFGGALVLLRAVPPERALAALPQRAAHASGTPRGATRVVLAEAEAYLDGLCSSLVSTQVSTQVRVGAPPEEIVAAARETMADLIVMSTHGRTGITRLLYGSVAEAVLRGSPVPVLMVPSRVTVRLSHESCDSVRYVPVNHK